MSLGHANKALSLFLVDVVALGLTMFQGFVTKAAYTHLKHFCNTRFNLV